MSVMKIIFKESLIREEKELKLHSYKSNPDDLGFSHTDGSRCGMT
jgi:hypothetical protein